MVCLTFPPTSAPCSTQPRPWFHAALLYLCTLQMPLLLSASSKGLGKHTILQEPHCQSDGSGKPPCLTTHSSTGHFVALTLISAEEGCQMNRGVWLMAATEGRTPGCNSAAELLHYLWSYLARRHHTNFAEIQWSLPEGRTLAGSTHTCTMVALGADTQRFLLITAMKFIWKHISFSEASSPVLTTLSRCNLHCLGSPHSARKHALLQGVAAKARNCPAAPHPWKSS